MWEFCPVSCQIVAMKYSNLLGKWQPVQRSSHTEQHQMRRHPPLVISPHREHTWQTAENCSHLRSYKDKHDWSGMHVTGTVPLRTIWSIGTWYKTSEMEGSTYSGGMYLHKPSQQWNQTPKIKGTLHYYFELQCWKTSVLMTSVMVGGMYPYVPTIPWVPVPDTVSFASPKSATCHAQALSFINFCLHPPQLIIIKQGN